MNEISREELKEIIFECINEVVNEKTIFTNERYSIHMDGMMSAAQNYYKDPYVKICDGPSWTKSKNCLLFYFKDSSVGYHNEGKGDLEFKREIGIFLTNALNTNIRDNYKVVDLLNDSIKERFSYVNENEIYKIIIKDYSNATYRKYPRRKERNLK